MPKAHKDLRTISAMRNLGPACEADLNRAGIMTAQQLIDLGVEAAFIKMLLARKERGMTTKCCNAAYLYALHGAIYDIDWRTLPEAKKAEYKQLTVDMRESGQFA